MLAALLLSRQSFLNYYFVVAVWVLLAIGELPTKEPEAITAERPVAAPATAAALH